MFLAGYEAISRLIKQKAGFHEEGILKGSEGNRVGKEAVGGLEVRRESRRGCPG